MAETVAEIARLLKLGPDAPLQPPRFAKVVSVAGDTATVTLGGSNVDAVRCCACAADDVVLLETMPSGQLAAVATKGASGGGGGGLQSLTIGTVSGATFTDTGTATDPVLNLTVPTYSTLTCTEDSGGDTKEDVLAGTDTGQWHNGWREEKFSDGRLTKWKWQRFTATSGFNSLSMGITNGTAFSARPDVSVTIGPLMNSSYSPLTGYYVQGGISNFTNNTTVVIGAQAGLAGQLFCEVRMDGHWR